MAVEPTAPLYSGPVTMEDGTELASLSSDPWTDTHLQAAHTNGIVAGQSIQQRVDFAVVATKAVATTMIEVIGDVNNAAYRMTQRLSPDPNLNANAVEFATQLQATIEHSFLKGIDAMTQRLTVIGGSDIRKGIPPPPAPPLPPPVIVQQTGPKLKPAPLFTTQPKYIIDES